MNKKIADTIKWNADGLVPAVVQDFQSGQVLMLAYMNEDSLRQTLDSGETVFWSRSRKSLWKKGATSGNIQKVREILVDCDEDALVILVEQVNGACHTGHRSCFYRTWKNGEWLADGMGRATFGPSSADYFERIGDIIAARKRNPSAGSYVSSLLSRGEDAILKKIAEEAGEVLISSKGKKRDEIVWEIADLWFHTLILLGHHDLTLREVIRELEKREGKSGIRKNKEA